MENWILTVACTAMAAGAFPAAASAQVAGQYEVTGNCPGLPAPYRGDLSIVRNGALYALTWTIGPDVYQGTALEQKGVLSISYVSGGNNGLMQTRRKGKGYSGVWVTYGMDMICKESWVRR